MGENKNTSEGVSVSIARAARFQEFPWNSNDVFYDPWLATCGGKYLQSGSFLCIQDTNI